MSTLNPSYGAARSEQASALQPAHHVKTQFARTRETVQGFMAFVTAEHLSLATFQAFWRQDERASLTLRAIGQTLNQDLIGAARSVADVLALTESLSLPEFQASESAHLFATIDSIEPDESSVEDGRKAAEQFQYAVEARSALLRHILAVLSQRYPATSFTNLLEATHWTRAFSSLLQEAEQVIVGTQQLLYDEATAIQSHLDSLRERFEFLDAKAHAASVLVREDWRALLTHAEQKMLDQLEQRHERLSALAFGELRETRESGWLEVIAQHTVRHAPVLGSLLLTLAGGATLLSPPVRDALPRPALPDLSAITRPAEAVRRFPVLARHDESARDAFGQRAHDEVAQFFTMQPRPRGRQSLSIVDSGTLGRVLDELARFGYARREVLRLLGLGSANDLTEPLTLDLRWSQGGRPLLLPPYQPVTDTALTLPDSFLTQPGAPLSLLTQQLGLSLEQIEAENPGLGSPESLRLGQVIALPAVDWAVQEERGGGQDTLVRGGTLEQVGRALGLSPQTIAELNDIATPDTWRYEGQRLLLPVAPEPVAVAQPAPAPLPVAAPASPQPTVQFEGEARPITSLLVHHVAAADTLSGLAERYDTTLTTLMEDNRLANDSLQVGQMLLVRVSGRAVALHSPTVPTGLAGVRSNGSFPASRVPAAIVAVPQPADGEALIARYGSTVFPSLEAMPPDAHTYFAGTVQEVADFFNVRPGDIVGILQAENNNAGLRLHQPTVSSAGARGVAQIVARTWNGWSNPATEAHLTDLRAIEQHGGLGFDWNLREAWRAWKEGRSDGSALAEANADPMRFENSVAGIARHLVHWGLTRDFAARDPEGFRARLADAISVYNSGKPLAEAESFTQSAQNRKTTGDYVREAMAVAAATPATLITPAHSDALGDAYSHLMDQQLGILVSEQELAQALNGSSLAAQVAQGDLSAEEGAQQLLAQTLQHYLAEGRAARAANQPLPWPSIYDEASLTVQRTAVEYLGRPLQGWEVEALVTETGGNPTAITRAIANRADARLFAGAKQAFDRLLQRSERGLPIATHELTTLMQPLLAGYAPQAMSESVLQQAMEQVQRAIQRLPEYREVNGTASFSASPLAPMPRVIRAFGAPVTYQRGGRHTGIDIANPRQRGQEPPILAVEGGTVVHVGPLYCNEPDACRGGNSIVLEHGNQVYSIYSHNSAASVRVGQLVHAGQEIGRQGDEGYSFGSHLHFEVHTGAPFSGNWQQPFLGGQFEDPLRWLP